MTDVNKGYKDRLFCFTLVEKRIKNERVISLHGRGNDYEQQSTGTERRYLMPESRWRSTRGLLTDSVNT